VSSLPSRALLAAAGLAVLIAAAHSYLGERYILIRLFRRGNLPPLFGGTDFTEQTLRFAWHITSVAWVGLAALLLLLDSFGPAERARVAVVVVVVFGVTGVVALVASRGRHLSWLIFFAIAALTWWGTS
jgi:hypothetical protein